MIVSTIGVLFVFSFFLSVFLSFLLSLCVERGTRKGNTNVGRLMMIRPELAPHARAHTHTHTQREREREREREIERGREGGGAEGLLIYQVSQSVG